MKWVFKTPEGVSNSIYTNVRSFVTSGVQRLDEEEEERRVQRLRAAERRMEEGQRIRTAERPPRQREREQNQRLQVARRNKRLRAANRRIQEAERIQRQFEEQNQRLREQNQRLQVARRNKRARAAERRTLEITQVQNRRLLGNTIAHYEIQNHANLTPTDFLNATRPIVTDFFRRNPGNKFQLTLNFIVVKVDAAGNVVEEEDTGRSSRQEIVHPSTDVGEAYDQMKDKIIESFATFLQNGSGWRLKRVVKLLITKSRLNELRGSSHIPLPKKIANRKALINMENKDDKCFKWAVTRALNPVSIHAERITKELKTQAHELNWNGIEFPTPCTEKQFKTFEKNNNVSILVFGHEGDNIIPLYVSEAKHEKVVRLFFQKSKDGKTSHYCVVKSMSRLTSSQGRNHHARVWVCDFCLNSFSKEDVLNRHKLSCS